MVSALKKQDNSLFYEYIFRLLIRAISNSEENMVHCIGKWVQSLYWNSPKVFYDFYDAQAGHFSFSSLQNEVHTANCTA